MSSTTEPQILKLKPPQVQFQSRKDLSDPRVGEIIQAGRLEQVENAFALLGYPDDEGISLNGGRRGAAQGPDAIRNYFLKMTIPHFHSQESKRVSGLPLYDLGNIDWDTEGKSSIDDRHEYAAKLVEQQLRSRNRLICLGGGHDYGYPDAKAYAQYAESLGHKPLIINFDAHLDLRPLEQGMTSGTPFRKLLSEHPNATLIEIGLLDVCNSATHLQWGKERGVRALYDRDWRMTGRTPIECLLEILNSDLRSFQSAFISVDIDVFSSAFAPGASQSWPQGMTPLEFFPVFNWCVKRFQVPLLGIYEVSPPLDVDGRTSRLAASICHQFVFHS